ncbi:hypothetical protein [Streptomyces sp. NBC_00400]|uniref:hypothetical protein n=1 Tax=Streptomyces sp. NBC_00400 TaxID=2975737 RepID=UPI003FA719E1
MTQDLLIEHLRSLELFQWFVRAHLESAGGKLSTGSADGEIAAGRGRRPGAGAGPEPHRGGPRPPGRSPGPAAPPMHKV